MCGPQSGARQLTLLLRRQHNNSDVHITECASIHHNSLFIIIYIYIM